MIAYMSIEQNPMFWAELDQTHGWYSLGLQSGGLCLTGALLKSSIGRPFIARHEVEVKWHCRFLRIRPFKHNHVAIKAHPILL